jgi:long-chain acyl-CoA synthetase
MTFLESIFSRLDHASRAPVIREVRDGRIVSFTGDQLLGMIGQARHFLKTRGLKKGDRSALHAPNSVRWAALDLAMMAEGLIVVPLYARQAPAEVAAMLRDSTPSLIFSTDAESIAQIRAHWPVASQFASIDDAFAGEDVPLAPPYHHADTDPVAIIYTSGTSGEPKGVVLNGGNVAHVLRATNSRLDRLMMLPGDGGDGANDRMSDGFSASKPASSSAGPVPKQKRQADRVFHYLPFCFAASWISLLTFLSRNSTVTLSMDLTKLSDELKLAPPDYFINVPTLLERIRTKVEDTITERGGFAAKVFFRAKDAYIGGHKNEKRMFDSLYLSIARSMIFPPVRKSVGPNLKALISGSAPLSVETQLFFMMLGVPVLQVYGLTETTAICTMDDPRQFAPGRVGSAIPGLEMTVAENGEILARGPNIFPGYWQRPGETAKALQDGWFHTGDQGDADANGNWRITGRLKNLIILNSGHNIAPEPIEEEIAEHLPEAKQVVLVGNQRSFLTALVAVAPSNGSNHAPDQNRIRAALNAVNDGMPHYKQIRAFHVVSEPFTPESGLLTTMGKLKRDAITARFGAEIDRLYQKKPQ